MIVKESKDVVKYLKSRQLELVYLKTKKYLEHDFIKKVALKLRKPKNSGIYQFRITKKYRALAVKKDKTLYVFHISDHQ